MSSQPSPREVIVYLRQSALEATGARGVELSIASQTQRLLGYAHKQGWTITQTFSDLPDRTATQDVRPQREQAVQRAMQNRGILLVDGLSRVARSTLDALRLCNQLLRQETDLVALEEGIDTTQRATAPLSSHSFFRLMSSLSQLEREHIAPPYGFNVADDLEHIIVNKGEQAVIRKMIDWHAQGLSDEKVAEQLNHNDIPAKHGGRWDAAAVKRVLDVAVTSRWGDHGVD